jgi:hypothetical protein
VHSVVIFIFLRSESFAESLGHKNPIKCLSKYTLYLSNEQMQSIWHKNVNLISGGIIAASLQCYKEGDIFNAVVTEKTGKV